MEVLAEMSIWKLSDKGVVKINGKSLTEGTSSHIPENTAELLRRADSLIADGEFIIAMEIYRLLLAKDSSNRYLRQRLEELKSLILLSGLRKDVIIFRLEKFRDLLRKRRSEFMRGLQV